MDLALAIGLASAALCLLIAPISFAYIRLRRRQKSFDDLERGPQTAKVADSPETTDPEPTAAAATTKDASLRRFSWLEIESLTDNFSPAAVIGQGGFCTVYLARLPPSTAAAVKVHRYSERLHRAFRQELDALLRLRHPNIVSLLGYCDDNPEDGALVLEHAPNGTLHDRLHGGSGTPLLPWRQRTSIALRLARAMDYLHNNDPQVVHGDIKSANVLLDGRTDPKLCDFGSASTGFSAAVRSSTSAAGKPAMTGSPGYVDPHYFRTGMVSKKGDVYSFGVLLLELVTGEEAFCSETERPLTAAVGERLRKGEGVVVDPRLGEEYDAAEAAAVAELAARCVGETPSLRPSMAEVLRVLTERVASAGGDGGSDRKDEL